MAERLIQKVIFGKYKIIKLLGTGAFCYVFSGKNIINGEKVALKVEEWKKYGNLLEGEAYILFQLKGIGVPKFKSFGKFGNYKILVETLLGKSLDEISFIISKNFTLKDICMIGIQLIERLEYIHSKYIIHRDIKPENLLVDKETKRYIYLIDFGLSKKYRSGRTGNHIKFSLLNKLTGTARYASINALRGVEQSRRDDLESAGYVLIYLAKKRLPWQGLKIHNKIDRFKQIYKFKKSIEPEQLCLGLPNEFSEYIKYVRKLQFEENPDYKYLKGLFQIILNKFGFNNDLNFTWLTKEDKSYFSSNNVKLYENKKRKMSPQMKILQTIKFNIEMGKKINNPQKNNSSSRNNIRDIKGKLENSVETQLAQLDISLNIEGDEISNEINKNKNKMKNSYKSDIPINKEKEEQNDLKENIIKQIEKSGISKKGNNKVNNKESVTLIFDPINFSFNSVPISKKVLNNHNNNKNNNQNANIGEKMDIKSNNHTPNLKYKKIKIIKKMKNQSFLGNNNNNNKRKNDIILFKTIK